MGRIKCFVLRPIRVISVIRGFSCARPELEPGMAFAVFRRQFENAAGGNQSGKTAL